MRARLLVLVLLVPGILGAQAMQPPQAAVTQWEAGLMGGYRFEGEVDGFDSQFAGRRFGIDLDDGPVLGLSIAAPIGGVHQVELWVAQQSAEMVPDVTIQTELGDLDVTYLHLTVLRYWYAKLDTATYVGLGAGVTVLEPEAPGADDATHPSVSLFLGGKHPLSRRVALRGDLRGYWTFGDDELSTRTGVIRFGYPRDLIQVEATVGVSVVF